MKNSPVRISNYMFVQLNSAIEARDFCGEVAVYFWFWNIFSKCKTFPEGFDGILSWDILAIMRYDNTDL